MCYDLNMKEEIINISKNIGIDIIGFCDTKNLIVPYDKYKSQDELSYKSTFQVGNIADKDLSNEKYNIYNTAIVIGVSYKKVDMSDKSKVYLSSCSIGEDYHIVLKNKLEVIKEYLENKGYIGKIFVDNNPLDERLLAYNAGLGFFGINNLLINEKLGSYFYIGVLLTNASISSNKIIDSKCINCGLCKKVCPLGAINDNNILDSTKCISYLNQKKNITEEECNTHNWEVLYGVDMNTMISEFHEKYMHSYGEAKVVDDAKNIIDELKKNHNLYFVTARDAKLTDITKNWLNENGFEEIDVYLLGSDYKIQKAKELECHIFIEDNPSNAMQLANEGMKVLLIDTNYNKEIEHENIVRVNNWIDIHGFIQEYN